MALCRRRRKEILAFLVWVLIALTFLQVVILLVNHDQGKFSSFLLAPFMTPPGKTVREYERAERYEMFKKEKHHVNDKRFLKIAKEKREKLERHWRMQFYDDVKQNGDGAVWNNNKASSLYGKYKKRARKSHHILIKPRKIASTRSIIHKNEHSLKIQKPQICQIPNLDPYHPDAKPFIDYKWSKVKCNVWQRGYIRDGKLHLQINNAYRAGFYYIQRENEESFKLSEYHSILDTYTDFVIKSEGHFCLKFDSKYVTFFKHNLREYDGKDNSPADVATADSIDKCRRTRLFIYRHQTLFHKASNRCVTTRESGNKTVLQLSNQPEECQKDTVHFMFLPDGKLQHIVSKKCVQYQDINHFGFFKLSPCVNGTTFSMRSQHLKAKDLSVEIPLQEDFVRLEYVVGDDTYSEFHMYPLKEQSEKRKSDVSRDVNKVNVLMLMVDSMSRASVQRYMKRTYHMLEQDPNSFIMKGQTINGDGTTAQILAMLFGKLEKELPEARKGFENATYIDDWPFIIREYEQMGYKTLYSEDAPHMNIFNYRLKGFKRKPATKYLRPWWMAADEMFKIAIRHSEDCQHKFAYEYIKNFFREYKNDKKFMFHCSNIAHNNPQTSVMMDDDMVAMYDFLRSSGELDNTIVIMFADHGDRTAEFRATMQGKLEERLPFMSITVPSWFHQKFPNEIKNIKSNSEILTTHYDVHATLQHLKNFPHGVFTHKYGNSFFRDIASLNRTCTEAGIDSHWCPCLTYKKLDTNSAFIRKLTNTVVEDMNEKMFKKTKLQEMCVRLTLHHIYQANHVSTNKDVEDFFETAVNDECDECGIKKNKTLNFKNKVYELMFTVLPSNGKFEVTAEYNVKTKKVTIGEISRINIYGKQPECIAKDFPYMRKFCYCRDYKADE